MRDNGFQTTVDLEFLKAKCSVVRKALFQRPQDLITDKRRRKRENNKGQTIISS